MTIGDYQLPEELEKVVDNLIDLCPISEIIDTFTNTGYQFPGIRLNQKNEKLIRRHLYSIKGNKVFKCFLENCSLYCNLTICLSEKALIDGYDVLENVFGTAEILLAFLLDERKSIRGFALKKLGEPIVYKKRMHDSVEANKEFSKTFSPLLNTMLFVMPCSSKNMEDRASVKDESEKHIKKLSSDNNSLSKKCISLEKMIKRKNSELADISIKLLNAQKKNEELQQKVKALSADLNKCELDKRHILKENQHLVHQRDCLKDDIKELESKIQILKNKRKEDKDSFKQTLIRERQQGLKNVIEETIPLESNHKTKREILNEKIASLLHERVGVLSNLIILIDGHNFLNCCYNITDENHSECRSYLENCLSIFNKWVPKSDIYLFYDSDTLSNNLVKANTKVKVIFSGGRGENRADKIIMSYYDFLFQERVKNEISNKLVLITNDRDIIDYCNSAIIISAEDFDSILSLCS